jgi:mRNA interferase RelE/StbE
MPYSVSLAPAAARQMRALPQQIQARLFPAIADLANDPRPLGSRKLTGEADLYRIRVGNYCIVYAIDDDAMTVTVVKVGDRKDVYRRSP